MNWLSHLLLSTYWPETGRGYAFWSGPGSDIGELAIVGALADVARRMVRHHRAQSAQAERHHAERQAQATAHHNALRQLAEAHHQELKAHVTAVLRPPAARRGRT